MPIACPQCQAQNADGARFCRACGTTLVAAAPPAEAAAATGVTCDDCGHLNAAGTRYCAKCGYSLVGTVIVSRRDSALGALAPAQETPAAAAPVRARLDEDSDSFDALSAPTQAMGMNTTSGEPAGRFSQMAAGTAVGTAAAAPSRTGLWIGLGVVALLVLAGGGWWLMKPAASPVQTAAPAAPPVAPAPAPAPTATAAPPPAPAPAAAPPVAAVPVEPSAVAPQAAPPAAVAQPPVAAADPAAAQRADAREKAARERAERDARARAMVEQRDQELARQRAEQDAARARAAAAQQARPAPPPVAAAPAPAAAPTVQGVREACAGRNPISQALCEARECRKPEYASQAVCKQLKEVEERRLYQ